MAAPLSPTKLLVCPGCQAKLPAESMRPGQKCRCGKCGKLLVVPGGESPRPAAAKPELFGFNCRVCDTRLVARTTDVGKKLRCPDCGARNDIPKPDKPRPKQKPQAMFGQQYGLWDVDEAPSSADLLARQPKFFPVYCRVCDTLMHALEKQVGNSLTCPDCGAQTKVPPPPAERPKPSVLVPDGEEYELEEPEIDLVVFDSPEPEPEFKEPPQKTLRDELREEYGERPDLPTIPLVQGVGRMFFRMPIPAWWLALSVMWCIVAVLLIAGFDAITSEFGALFALCCVASGAILGFLTFLAFAVLCMSILIDSLEGNDKLYNAPDANVIDWFGGALYIALALAVSMAPGALLGALWEQRAVGALFGSFFLFPIVLLSMLEVGSPIGLLSPRVLASLALRPLHWLLFYLVTAVLAAVPYVGLALMPISAAYLLPAVPLLLAGDLLYFRLLGRLAWWLAESLPAPEPSVSD